MNYHVNQLSPYLSCGRPSENDFMGGERGWIGTVHVFERRQAVGPLKAANLPEFCWAQPHSNDPLYREGAFPESR